MIKVKLHSINNAGPKQTAIANEAINLLEKVLNSADFAERVKNNKFNSSWRLTDSGKDVRVTNEDLLEIILTGKERQTESDYEMDLIIELKKRRKGILGGTPYPAYPGVKITTAYWFINDCIYYKNPSALAAHWMHEWLHSAGLYHLDQDNDDFNDAIYNTGEITESVARKILSGSNKMIGSPFLLKDIIGPPVTISGIVYETARSLSEADEGMM